MNKMIIGLCGPAGSGKDAIADHLVSKHGFVKMANVDLLKRVARDVFGFTNEQLWGPSEARNAPDKRYPREHGPFTWDVCCRCCTAQGKKQRKWTEDHSEDVIELPESCYLTPRFVLQSLGTEWGRLCYPNIWVERLLGLVQELQAGGCFYDPKEGVQRLATMRARPGVVISDVRFLNEIDAIKAAGGKIVRVIRGASIEETVEYAAATIREGLKGYIGQEQTSVSSAAAAHTSETELLGIPAEKFAYVLQNSGDLHFLQMQADRMMDVLEGRIISFDAALQDAPPFLRGKCQKLFGTMRALSRKYLQADWHEELPDRLWYALQNKGELGVADHDTLPVFISEEELQNLKELSDAVNGWFSWQGKEHDAPYFVQRGAWLEEYAKRRP